MIKISSSKVTAKGAYDDIMSTSNQSMFSSLQAEKFDKLGRSYDFWETSKSKK